MRGPEQHGYGAHQEPPYLQPRKRTSCFMPLRFASDSKQADYFIIVGVIDKGFISFAAEKPEKEEETRGRESDETVQ